MFERGWFRSARLARKPPTNVISFEDYKRKAHRRPSSRRKRWMTGAVPPPLAAAQPPTALPPPEPSLVTGPARWYPRRLVRWPEYPPEGSFYALGRIAWLLEDQERRGMLTHAELRMIEHHRAQLIAGRGLCERQVRMLARIVRQAAARLRALGKRP